MDTIELDDCSPGVRNAMVRFHLLLLAFRLRLVVMCPPPRTWH